MIKHILFDLDGTLVNSFVDIVRSSAYAFKKMGIYTTWAEVFQICKEQIDLQQCFRQISGDTSVEGFNSFIELYKEGYASEESTSTLFPGVSSGLQMLREKYPSIPLSVGTLRDTSITKELLTELDINLYFNCVIGCGREIPPKPAPDIVHRICEESGVDPQDTISIGDTLFDIEMGHRAECNKVWSVTYGLAPRAKIEAHDTKPDAMFDTFRDVCLALDTELEGQR